MNSGTPRARGSGPRLAILLVSALGLGLALLARSPGRGAEGLQPATGAFPGSGDSAQRGRALEHPRTPAGTVTRTDGPALSVPAREAAGATFAVRVTSQRGAGLPGARIELHQGGRVVRRIESDRDGVARASGLDPGIVGVALLSESLPPTCLPPPPLHGIPQHEGGGAVCRTVELPAGQQTDLHLSIPVAARLQGWISREDGSPVADARLTLLALDAPIARRVSHTRTDALGSFAIERLGAGRHLLKSSHDKDSLRTLPVEIRLEEGESRAIHLVAGRWTARVYGSVRDPSGQARRGLQLRAFFGSTPVGRARTDDHGRFAFDALPREVLRIELDPGNAFPARQVDLRARDVDLGPLIVEHPRRFTLHGRVDAGGTPPQGLRALATYLRRDGSDGHTVVLPVQDGERFLFECGESVQRVRIDVSDDDGRSASLDVEPSPGRESRVRLDLADR